MLSAIKRIGGDGASEGRDAGGTEAAPPSLALSPPIRMDMCVGGKSLKGLNPTKERLGGRPFQVLPHGLSKNEKRCSWIAKSGRHPFQYLIIKLD